MATAAGDEFCMWLGSELVRRHQEAEDTMGKLIVTAMVTLDGVAGGEPWTLVAYESNAGLRLEIRGVTPANGGGGGCGFDVPEWHSVSMNAEVFGDPAVTVLYGPVAKDVARVTLTLSGGAMVDRPTRASPTGLGFDGRFYTELVPGAPSIVSIAGTSVGGLTVEQRTE